MELKFGKDVSSDFVKEKLKWNSKYYVKIGKKYAKMSSLKQKQCYICFNKKSKKVASVFGLNYLMCQKCNHVYTDRRLDEKGLTKYYTEDPDYFNNPYTRKNILNLRDQIFKPKIEYVKKFIKGKKWLDVGSGDGAAVSAAKKAGFDAKGLEISNTGRAFAKKYRKIDLFNGTLTDFSNQNKTKWDVISFYGVIEHVPEPVTILREANKILKIHGLVLIEVPNFECYSTYFQKLTQSPDRHLTIPGHIMLYTKKSAEYLFKKNGFQPISTWYYGMDAIELLKYMNQLDPKFIKSELFEELVKKINQIQYVFDSSEKSDTFLMIGRKTKNI